METYKVYAHINNFNQKAYIGITKRDLNTRWGKNGSGYKAQDKFYKAIQKYGWENFEHKVLASEIYAEEEALELETYYIEYYDSIENGYNILKKGIASYPRHKPVFCITTQIKYDSIKEAAQSNKLLPSDIIENCKGKRGPVKGLSWTYWDIENNKPFVPKDFIASPKPNAQQIYCLELNCYYDSIGEACKILNIDKRGMQKALNQERIGIQGKHFVRANELDKLIKIATKDTGKFKKIYCKEKNKIFNSLQEAALFCGKTPQSIMKNCQHKTEMCDKYHFCYVSELQPEFVLKYYQERAQGEAEDE